MKGWPAEASIYEWPAEANVYDNLARPSLSHKSMQQGHYVESLTRDWYLYILHHMVVKGIKC